MDCHRNLCAHAHGLSEGGAPLAQATGGEKPLAWTTGDWVLLVQARVARQLLCGLKNGG